MASRLNISSDTDITYLPGVGPYRASLFNKESIFTAQDLLFYYPAGYLSRQEAVGFREIRELIRQGDSKKEITVTAEITGVTERRIRGGRSMINAKLKDMAGDNANAVFFNRTAYHRTALKKGKIYTFTGKADDSKYGLQFTHPIYRPATAEESIANASKKSDEESGDSIMPRYRIKDSMAKAGISDNYLRKLMKAVLDALISQVEEPIPSEYLHKRDLPPLPYSIRNLHFPDSQEILEKCQARMKYQEMLDFQTSLRLSGINKIAKEGVNIEAKSQSARNIYERLPFDLTKDQKKTLNEISRDFQSGKPMNRLLQGDVGAGKTLVALLTMLMAVDSGYQTLLLAPTEILAEQHYRSILKYLESTNIQVGLLTGGLKSQNKNDNYAAIANGNIDIVIGTHALFQEKVSYNRLGYIVIDEQHRFGVEQRAKIRDMGTESLRNPKLAPHILLMSATPIPRTISMSLYGDLDLSFIKTKPAQRLPIITKVEGEANRKKVYEFCGQELAKGHKVFMLYPLVEESDKLDLMSVEEAYESIVKAFPGHNVAMLHGRMSSQEKDSVMMDFKNGKYSILVATTVIEVGIDIPEATVILINHAERFGLSQLHQLRGRVGRSNLQSYCYLLTENRYAQGSWSSGSTIFGEVNGSTAGLRLKVMEDSNDGFYISEKDLEIRGPGDLMGVRQSGIPDFRFADLASDMEIIKMAREDSSMIMESYQTEGKHSKYLEYLLKTGRKDYTNVG